MTEPRKVKVRDLPPTSVRLDPLLRNALSREATINGRTLHNEIVLRLTRSIEGAEPPTAHPHGDRGAAPGLSDSERTLLTLFRRLPPEKQLGLLSLLR